MGADEVWFNIAPVILYICYLLSNAVSLKNPEQFSLNEMERDNIMPRIIMCENYLEISDSLNECETPI